MSLKGHCPTWCLTAFLAVPAFVFKYGCQREPARGGRYWYGCLFFADFIAPRQGFHVIRVAQGSPAQYAGLYVPSLIL
mgnify:FL=1